MRFEANAIVYMSWGKEKQVSLWGVYCLLPWGILASIREVYFNALYWRGEGVFYFFYSILAVRLGGSSMSARLSASAISLTYDAIPYSQKAKLSGFVLFSFSLTRLRYDTIPKQGAVRFTTTVLGRYSYSKTLNERHTKKSNNNRTMWLIQSLT